MGEYTTKSKTPGYRLRVRSADEVVRVLESNGAFLPVVTPEDTEEPDIEPTETPTPGP